MPPQFKAASRITDQSLLCTAIKSFVRSTGSSMEKRFLTGGSFSATLSSETDAVLLAAPGDGFVLIAASASFSVKEVGCRFSTSYSAMLPFFFVPTTTSAV